MSFPPSLEKDFELLETLPSGKLFQCYRVRDHRKKGTDAVLRLAPKTLSRDRDFVDQFHDFFSRFNSISNRNYIPSVYSAVGVTGKDVYVIEEYCRGISFLRFVEQCGKSQNTNSRVMAILARVCEALHHAHQKSIFHLCVTPSDILIDPDDEKKVKLVGFGTQILLRSGLVEELPSEFKRFLARELFSGFNLRPEVDVYSLAMTAREILPDYCQQHGIFQKAISTRPAERFAAPREFASRIIALHTSDNQEAHRNRSSNSKIPQGGLQPVLTVITDPIGAVLTVDGEMIGESTEKGLSIPWRPNQEIIVEKMGYQAESLYTGPDYQSSAINIKLKPLIRLFVSPWGASVSVNEATLGSIPPEGMIIPWDKSLFLIKKDGFETYRLNLDSPPAQNQVCVELKPLTVLIPAHSNWAQKIMAYMKGIRLIRNISSDPSPSSSNASGTRLVIGSLAGVVAILCVTLLLVILISQATSSRSLSVSSSTDGPKNTKTNDDELKKLNEMIKNTESSKAILENRVKTLESQLSQKESEFARLSTDKARSLASLENELNNLKSENNTKSDENSRLAQANNNYRSSVTNLETKINYLNSQIAQKDSEINRLTTLKNQQSILLEDYKKQISAAKNAPQPQAHLATQKPGVRNPDDSVSKSYDLFEASWAGEINRVKELLSKGYSPNLLDDRGNSALIYAATMGHVEIARLLINNGANVKTKNRRERTALDFAIRWNRKEMMEFLRSYP